MSADPDEPGIPGDEASARGFRGGRWSPGSRRSSGYPPDEMHTLELPARRTSAGAARRFVERIVRRLGLDAATERDAALLTSELATNALFHAETPFRVGVDVDDERVRVEVLDRSGRAPQPRTPTDDDIGGRGLRIVESVADRWGHAAHPEGKVVWFELPVDGRRGSGDGETVRV